MLFLATEPQLRAVALVSFTVTELKFVAERFGRCVIDEVDALEEYGVDVDLWDFHEAYLYEVDLPHFELTAPPGTCCVTDGS